MVELQNSDGGFPFRGRIGNPSCLNDTCFWIGKLIKDPSKEAKESLRKACDWVLSTQLASCSESSIWSVCNT